MNLRDVNVSELEMRRGWLGAGRDKAEDDPTLHGMARAAGKLDAAIRKRCETCEGVGYTEAAAFMCEIGLPDRCPACNGSGRA